MLLFTKQSEQHFNSSWKQQDDPYTAVKILYLGIAILGTLLALHTQNARVTLEAFWAASEGSKGRGKAASSSPPLALLHLWVHWKVCICLSRPVWSGRKHSWAAGLRHPSITVNKWNGGPLHHFIYYFNDYIDHCLLIVSVIDLINFQLITEGDI